MRILLLDLDDNAGTDCGTHVTERKAAQTRVVLEGLHRGLLQWHEPYDGSLSCPQVGWVTGGLLGRAWIMSVFTYALCCVRTSAPADINLLRAASTSFGFFF